MKVKIIVVGSSEQIRKNIGTDGRQGQRIKDLHSLQISYPKAAVHPGKKHIDHRIDRDQHPVTFPPEGLIDQAPVIVVPDIGKSSRLRDHDDAGQAEHDKSFIIIPFPGFRHTYHLLSLMLSFYSTTIPGKIPLTP